MSEEALHPPAAQHDQFSRVISKIRRLVYNIFSYLCIETLIRIVDSNGGYTIILAAAHVGGRD